MMGSGDFDRLVGGKKNHTETGLTRRSVACDSVKLVQRKYLTGAPMNFSMTRRVYLLYNDIGKYRPRVVGVNAGQKCLVRQSSRT